MPKRAHKSTRSSLGKKNISGKASSRYIENVKESAAQVFKPLGKKTDDLLERQLESAVFGTDEDLLQNLEDTYKSDDSDGSEFVVEECNERPHKVSKSAWHDEDDDEMQVSHDTELNKKLILGEKRENYVKKQFTQVMGQQPTWAKLNHARRTKKDATSEDEDEISGRAGNFLAKSERLLSRILDYRKCPDLNKSCKDVSIIKHVEFHPSAQVAVTAGISGTISLFQVDGKSNPSIQTVNFDNFPIERAHFSKDGEEVIVGASHKSHFYSYDMIKGKINRIRWDKGMELRSMKNFEMSPDGKFIAIHGNFGHVHILTSKAKEWVSSVKLNSTVSAITFDLSGNYMYTHSHEGEVYIWDSRNWGHCCHKFFDDGCIHGTALSLSPSNQYLACGSSSGVVNIYDNAKLMSSTTPKPDKTLLNLTTKVNDLKFNHNSEILAMSSSYKNNAVKLVHFPSMTVFENFPLSTDNFRMPQSIDISLNSGYLTFANNTGRAFLFRLNRYNNF